MALIEALIEALTPVKRRERMDGGMIDKKGGLTRTRNKNQEARCIATSRRKLLLDVGMWSPPIWDSLDWSG